MGKGGPAFEDTEDPAKEQKARLEARYGYNIGLNNIGLTRCVQNKGWRAEGEGHDLWIRGRRLTRSERKSPLCERLP